MWGLCPWAHRCWCSSLKFLTILHSLAPLDGDGGEGELAGTSSLLTSRFGNSMMLNTKLNFSNTQQFVGVLQQLHYYR